MSLFRKGTYSATVLVQGTRHTLKMIHPSVSKIGLYEAICLDYNGSTYRAHAKGATKGEADRGLAEKLGLIAPSVASKPRAKFIANTVIHVPASEFRGIQYPARTFVAGPALHEVCQDLEFFAKEGLATGEIRFIPAKPGVVGKYRAKAEKWELSTESLQDFWALVHSDLAGQELRIIDKTQGSGEPLDITV